MRLEDCKRTEVKYRLSFPFVKELLKLQLYEDIDVLTSSADCTNCSSIQNGKRYCGRFCTASCEPLVAEIPSLIAQYGKDNFEVSSLYIDDFEYVRTIEKRTLCESQALEIILPKRIQGYCIFYNQETSDCKIHTMKPFIGRMIKCGESYVNPYMYVWLDWFINDDGNLIETFIHN